VHVDAAVITAPAANNESLTELRQEAIDRLVSAAGAKGAGLVLGAMVDSAPRLLGALRRAIADGNAKELRRSAHSLKANAATVGADALARMFQELEDVAATEDLSSAADKVSSAEQAYGHLVAAIDSLRKKLA
jgi:HPt (histidine-containing phosphotransfer) domain-containing protein